MYSRRELLAGLGVGGVAALAGCSGSAGPGGGGGAGAGGVSASSGPDSALLGATPVLGGRLQASDGIPTDGFGLASAVSADGRVVLAGAPTFASPEWTSPTGPRGGRVHLFEYVDGAWTERATLDPEPGEVGFGRAVALSADGSTAVVGTPFHWVPTADDERGLYTGSVTVFERVGSEWTRGVTLFAEDGVPDSFFGAAVSLSAAGDALLVGSPGAFRGLGSGGETGAHLFEREEGNWTQVAKLESPRPETGLFGHAVALSGDGGSAVVGAPQEPGQYSGRTVYVGAAYVYERTADGFRQVGRLLAEDDPSTGAPVWEFGSAVSTSGDGGVVLVGGTFPSRGVADVFERSESGWRRTGRFEPAYGINAVKNSMALSADGATVAVFGVSGFPEGASLDVHGSTSGDDPGDSFLSPEQPPVVYLFGRSKGEWELLTVLETPDRQPAGRLVRDATGLVALSGDGSTVVFGAPGDGDRLNEYGPGVAFVYGVESG